MIQLLAANLSTKIATTDGNSAWTPPEVFFGESLTLALRFIQSLGGGIVEADLDIRALKASVGEVDARPLAGKWALQCGAGSQTGANTTGLLAYNATPAQVAAAIVAKTAITDAFGTPSVTLEDGSYLITFGTGGAQVAMTIRDNTLWPVSFGHLSAYQIDGVWRHEVRLTQAPVAFSDAGARVLPPPPSITEVQGGAQSGAFTWNEIQSLFVPPTFRGTYQLRLGTLARTGELSTADTAETIQAALKDAYGDDFLVTNPDFQTFRIEFVNSLAGPAGGALDLAVFALDPPPGDYTFTLAFDRAELAARLRKEETVTLPLEVRLQVADADEVLTWIVALRQDLVLRRGLATPDEALVPGVDWLIPLSPEDYIPFNRESVITGQQFYRAQLGDGSATSFPVSHGLATNYVFAWVRQNSAPGNQLIEGTDYRVTVTDANTVTITALGSAPSSNAWLVTIVSAQTVAAFADGLEIEIGQVTGLEDRLEALEALLAKFNIAPPSAGTQVDSGSVLSIPFREFAELFFGARSVTPLPSDLDDPALRGRRLLPAINASSPTSFTSTTALPSVTTSTMVWQNNSGQAWTLPGGSVDVGGYFGSDGTALSGLFGLSRQGSGNSYFPTQFERELWRIECNDAMLLSGRALRCTGFLSLRTVAANTDLQCVLVVEWGKVLDASDPIGSAIALSNDGTGTNHLVLVQDQLDLGAFTVVHGTGVFTLTGNTLSNGDVVTAFNTTPDTTHLPGGMTAGTQYVVRDKSGDTFKLALDADAPNLQDIAWQGATPLLTQRIVIAPTLQPHNYVVAIARDGSGVSASRSIYASVPAACATPPTTANFALRARLINFDTRNPVPKPHGFIYYTSSGTAVI